MRKTKSKMPLLFLSILMAWALFLPCSSVQAGRLSSADVEALAIYVANVNNRDDLPDSLVNYNVTNPSVIDAIFSGIEFQFQLDCADLDADNTSILYVKLKNGTRKVYQLFLHDSHISLKYKRAFCFFVTASARSLLEANAQP